jgi:oligopeptide transport system substrate-binding protein
LFAGAAHAETELHVALVDQPRSLDPDQSNTLPETRVLIDLFEGLLRTAPDGSLQPGVAVTWKSSPDRTQWDFALRENASWSDGTPVTASDFVNAWRRNLTVQGASGPINSTLNRISGGIALAHGDHNVNFGAVALDPHHLHVTFAVPFDDLAAFADDEYLFPLPVPSLTAPATAWVATNRLVGNGPYQMAEWTPSRILLKKSKTYWDQEAAKIDRVVFIPIEDSREQFKRFRTKNIDITNSVPTNQLDWVHDNMPKELVSSLINRVLYLAVNPHGEAWTKDPNVRRALSLATDRSLLATGVLKGLYVPSDVYVPASMVNYPSPGAPDIPSGQNERIAEAKRLWSLPGPKRPQQITITYATSERNLHLMTALADMWKHTLRINVVLRNVEFDTLMTVQRQRDYEVCFANWTERSAEAFLYRFLSNAGDAMLQKSQQTADRVQSRSQLAQAETILLRDGVVIPLLQMRLNSLVAQKIHGFHTDGMGRFATRDLSIAP